MMSSAIKVSLLVNLRTLSHAQHLRCFNASKTAALSYASMHANKQNSENLILGGEMFYVYHLKNGFTKHALTKGNGNFLRLF